MPLLSFPLTLEFEQMPLAVYRELSAHLRQLDGLEVEILPQTSPHFDYNQSQVRGIRLHDPADSAALESILESAEQDGDRQCLKQILAYYHDRYPLRDASCLD
ncbi:MAG: hypothetical protein ACOYME_01295 [Prochlorotrichaceae cyanobacterium]|jgi:hypothetical protein